MKKILIVNNNMQLGGVQKALVSLLHEIKDQYDITLFLFSPDGPCYTDIPKEVKVVTAKSLYRCFGISQTEAKGMGGLYLWRAAMAALTKLFGRGTAVFLANLSQPKLKVHYDAAISYLHSGGQKSFYGGCNEFVLRKVNATKKVTFLHGDYSRCGANHPKTNRLYQKFDLVAACSAGCRESFVHQLPDMAERCVVVPNCHNFEKMRINSQRDTLTYENGAVHVLTIARLSGEKGVERAINAVAYAKAQGIHICYHIVGDGIERNALEALRDRLKLGECVRFYGNQENPYRFLPGADLLLIPSYHEAAPLVIDEARCFGVPVLSTETSSAKDMITKRNLGWVCENSQEAISEALVEAVEDSAVLQEKKKTILQMECTNQEAVSAFYNIMR